MKEQTVGAFRLASLKRGIHRFEKDAGRLVRKGKLRMPTEFNFRKNKGEKGAAKLRHGEREGAVEQNAGR